jgi:hypothetical protein
MKQILFVLCSILLSLQLTGCGEDKAIRSYKVAKVKPPSESTAVEPAQMLGLILPNQGNAWFLKLTDAPEKVQALTDDFRSLASSLRFDAQGKPVWELSANWEEKLLQQITYAKFLHQAGAEATLTQLAANTEDAQQWEAYVKENVNRWRKQVELDPQDWPAMQRDLEEFPSHSTESAKAYFVNISGKRSVGGSNMGSGAPFLDRMRAEQSRSEDSATDKPTGDAPQSNTPSASRPSLSYTVPEQWKELPASGIRLANFEVEQDGQTASVVISTAGGELEASIGMWLEQAGLEPNADRIKQINEQATTGKALETEYRCYLIEGQGEDANTIRVAVLPTSLNYNFYVKMVGKKAIVAAQSAAMDQFIASLKF